MNVLIRVDASIEMGSGHVMRCLTLAKVLKQKGVEVGFICREHEGNLNERIEQQGFLVYRLRLAMNLNEGTNLSGREKLYGTKWLGATQEEDAKHCKPILEGVKPDWLIVDHYAIDHIWQNLLKKSYKKLMVIDDLADRKHQCNLLLDQTYGRKLEDYIAFVPQSCHLILGSQYALLRPEFAEWREYSLKRRVTPKLRKLLITMGGVDNNNMTGKIMSVLKTCDLPEGIELTVVMGELAPHSNAIKKQAKAMPYKTDVKINVDNMAELMANSDLAIAAAGATTWERCCLGLPSIQIVIADNQKVIAELINKAEVALCIEKQQVAQLRSQMTEVTKQFKHLIENSANVSDGMGALRVSKYLK